MSGLRDGVDAADLDGGDPLGTQCPPNADHSVNRHGHNDRDKQSGECRIDIVVDDDALHFLDGFGRSKDFACRQCVAEPPGMADKADGRG